MVKIINILLNIINIYKFVLFPDSTWRSVISTPPHFRFGFPKIIITGKEVAKVSELGILVNSNFFFAHSFLTKYQP